jgi:hypothetical protein
MSQHPGEIAAPFVAEWVRNDIAPPYLLFSSPSGVEGNARGVLECGSSTSALYRASSACARQGYTLSLVQTCVGLLDSRLRSE